MPRVELAEACTPKQPRGRRINQPGSRSGERGTIIPGSPLCMADQMPNEKLSAVLAEIRDQLARADGLSGSARRSLEQLVRDLEAHVDREADPAQEHDESLSQRLADWVRRLESSHPALSTTLGNVIDTLAFFGL
jgi:hypothetical protein